MVEPAQANDAVAALTDWATQNGAQGLIGFASVHAAAIVVCFPATLLFEFAAGLAFGLWPGVAVVWAAKVAAATLTYLASLGVARALLAQLNVPQRARDAFCSQPGLSALAADVEAEGAKFTVLARLSPIPSWLNNYGLGLAGVRFAPYLGATALASVPSVLTHVYAGSLLPSLLAVRDEGVPDTWLGAALSGLSLLGGAALLREALLAASSEPPREAARAREARRRVPSDPRCSADPEQGEGEGAALRALWRSARARLPPLLTGAAGSDGDDDPAGALFNMFFIRLPFLLACAALVANVLLGGGVKFGGLVWPLVGYEPFSEL
jgi:uncharacterized membrane protein YdjX (TVP38/TMEM64 family)